MRIKNHFNFIFLIAFFSNCVNENFENPQEINCTNPDITKTEEVANIYKKATATTSIYTDDDVIEGYIISSDSGGNFYKIIYIQPLDGTSGLSLSLDVSYLYTKGFQAGRRVYLKLKNLAFVNPTSQAKGLIFGFPKTQDYPVDRIPESILKNHLLPTCERINEEKILHKINLNQSKTDTYLNTLIEIDDVQFVTDCTRYSSEEYDTNLKITSDGKTNLDIRTSKYANFAGNYVPSGRGKIRGVLTKYGSTYQLIVRTEQDIKLNNPRAVIAQMPLGGTNVQFLGSFTENFESYTKTTKGATLPKYINEITIGSKYWDIDTYSGNNYLTMSGYNTGCVKNYFIIPVDFTLAKSFSFKTLDGYYNGDPLKVYYSTDYNINSGIEKANLVDITSNFKLAKGSKEFANNFTNSGTFGIPDSLTGNGFFIFEYNNTTGITTTIQIDDIMIK